MTHPQYQPVDLSMLDVIISAAVIAKAYDIFDLDSERLRFKTNIRIVRKPGSNGPYYDVETEPSEDSELIGMLEFLHTNLVQLADNHYCLADELYELEGIRWEHAGLGRNHHLRPLFVLEQSHHFISRGSIHLYKNFWYVTRSGSHERLFFRTENHPNLVSKTGFLEKFDEQFALALRIQEETKQAHQEPVVQTIMKLLEQFGRDHDDLEVFEAKRYVDLFKSLRQILGPEDFAQYETILARASKTAHQVMEILHQYPGETILTSNEETRIVRKFNGYECVVFFDSKTDKFVQKGFCELFGQYIGQAATIVMNVIYTSRIGDEIVMFTRALEYGIQTPYARPDIEFPGMF
jgi:hypothetical protein